MQSLNPLKQGDNAPEFTMFDSDKQQFSLSSLRGSHVLLHFFPAAFTSTCTKQLCNARDDLFFYNNMNAKVIGISTDSVYVLRRYKEEQNLNFILASDYNKDVCESYDAKYELFNYGMKGVAKRAAFVIDRNGFIRYAEVLEDSGKLPDFDAIKKTLESLEH